MAYSRGTVRWGPAPHRTAESYRPWVVLSTDDHPFAHAECIAAAMTTQPHSEGIAVPDGAWVEGGADTRSYVSPWYVATFKHSSFDRKQGRLSEHIVSRVAGKTRAFVSAAA